LKSEDTMISWHACARLGTWLWMCIFLVSCNFSLLPLNNHPTALPEYWPTSAWQTSTPEQQGIDSARLVAMLAEIQNQAYPIHGLVVIRNGYLVLELYTPPFQADSRHYIASASKSFTSALIGIALEQGDIPGLEAQVLDLLPGRTVLDPDPRKQAITLEHLLTMSSGLDWPTQGLREQLGDGLQAAQDEAQFVLDRPMAVEPGATFNYNTGGTLLLSAILAQATGQSALEYAQERLFTPLGITNVQWWADLSGITQGGSGLELTPRDMAKFGYLYLKDGIWEGKTLIPAEWVKTSTQAHIEAGYLDLDYGYQWWVHPSGVYQARGFGGQRIFVLPEQQMVVVFVSGFSGDDMEYVPDALLNTYLLPAAQEGGALPDNPEQRRRLAEQVQALETSVPKPIHPFPRMAKQVSGQTYAIPPNSLGVSSMKWDFSANQAWIEVTFGDSSPLKQHIGLDGIYRANSTSQPGSPIITYYLKGAWVSEDTFILYAMRDGASVIQKIVFQENGLELNIYLGGRVEKVYGTVKL
jgi:CubicO group peptidase (beta-lactamase class C family)